MEMLKEISFDYNVNLKVAVVIKIEMPTLKDLSADFYVMLIHAEKTS